MKLGLVLEGGASRAYFSTGVMDFLLEQNINADYVIGVSAGIANGASYVTKQIGRNIEIGEKYAPDKRYMGLRHLLNPKKRSYYNLDFVFGELPEKYVPFDYEAFANSNCQTVAGVTNMRTGTAEYITIDTCDTSWKPIIASCSLPLLFQPVEIGGELYLDGGIADPIPVNRAIEDGCDKIIVVTTRERSYRKTKETGVKLSSIVYRKYPNLVNLLLSRVENYNKSREHLIELEKQGKVFVIAPDNTSNWGRINSDPKTIRMMHNLGYETAQSLLPKLLKYINTGS